MENKAEQFLSKLNKGDHVLLLYEDANRAKRIRLEFIKTGLELGEHCVYITAEKDDKEFESGLEELGINVEQLKSNNHFSIFHLDDPFNRNGGFGKSIEKTWKQITQVHKSPLRIACNIVGDISKKTAKQLDDLLITEKCVNEGFAKSEDYLLCTYDIDNISPESKQRFFEGIKHHDAIIFAPKNGKGIGFFMN